MPVYILVIANDKDIVINIQYHLTITRYIAISNSLSRHAQALQIYDGTSKKITYSSLIFR